jgi:hypothetical protein
MLNLGLGIFGVRRSAFYREEVTGRSLWSGTPIQ